MLIFQRNVEASGCARSQLLGSALSASAWMGIVTIAICLPLASSGATFTWDGSSDNNIGTNANWAGNSAPPTPNSGASTDTFLFGAETGGAPDYIVNLDQGNNSDVQPVGFIDIASNAGAYVFTNDGTNTFEVLGVSAGLTDPGDFYGIRNQSSNLITFDMDFISAAQGGSSPMERLIFDSGTGGLLFNGTISFNSNAKDIVMRGSSDITATESLNFDNTTGSSAVFQVQLDAANTFEAQGTLQDMPGVRLISGTLLLTHTGSDIIVDPSGTSKQTALEMQGGTLLFADAGAQTAAFRKTLTLSADSTIDLGTGGTVTMRVASASATAWTGGTILSIENWKGTLGTGGGDDQIYFGTTSGGLTAGQLSQIRFVNPNGLAPGVYFGQILGDGEVVPGGLVPVPEPSAVAATVCLAMLIGWRERKRFKRCFAFFC